MSIIFLLVSPRIIIVQFSSSQKENPSVVAWNSIPSGVGGLLTLWTVPKWNLCDPLTSFWLGFRFFFRLSRRFGFRLFGSTWRWRTTCFSSLGHSMQSNKVTCLPCLSHQCILDDHIIIDFKPQFPNLIWNWSSWKVQPVTDFWVCMGKWSNSVTVDLHTGRAVFQKYTCQYHVIWNILVL